MKNKLIFALSLVALVVVWHVASLKLQKPILLPTIAQVLEQMRLLAGNGTLSASVYASLSRVATAMVISIVVAVPLALICVLFSGAKSLITPLTGMIRYVPVTVFYPLLIAWSGIGEQMKIAFLFVGIFFSILPASLQAFEGVSVDLIELVRTSGGTKLDTAIVYLRTALPSLCRSLLTAFSIGWNYIMLAEATNAEFGLGHLMTVGSSRGRTAMVFAAVIVVVAISLLVDGVGGLLIRAAFPWERRVERAKN